MNIIEFFIFDQFFLQIITNKSKRYEIVKMDCLGFNRGCSYPDGNGWSKPFI